MSFDTGPFDPIRWWGRTEPERLALVDRATGRRVTYGALDAEADRWGARLAAEGIDHGDRVAVLSANRIELVALLFGAVYTLTAIAAKFLGCGLSALLCRFNLRGAARIGAGMIPRGEVALVISGIGLSAGMLPPDIFGVGVLMTVVTTMAAPPLLVWLFRSPHPGISRGAERAASEPQIYEFPTPEIADLIANKLLAVFSEEGYFTHVLDAASNIFQIRNFFYQFRKI